LGTQRTTESGDEFHRGDIPAENRDSLREITGERDEKDLVGYGRRGGGSRIHHHGVSPKRHGLKGRRQAGGSRRAKIGCTRRVRRGDDASAAQRAGALACDARRGTRRQARAAHGRRAEARDHAPQRAAEEEQKSKTTTPQRGAEEEKSQTSTPQRGAASEHGMEQKKAQEEREPTQKGAQSETTKGETTKSGVSQSGKAQGSQQNAGKAPSGAGAKVQLSQSQRTRIHSILGKSEAASVRTNVNFNIAVGVAIPRDVHVEVLPEDVVEVVPQYEGYDYIIVGDQILIIDPDSDEIVAIIDA
jgi:hypothetical protein